MKFNYTLLFLFFIGLVVSSCDSSKTQSGSEPNTNTEVHEDNVANTKKDPEATVDPIKKAEEEKQAKIRARFEAAKNEPPTEEQKATGMKICKCMNRIKLLEKVIDVKSQEEFDKVAGEDAFDDVLALQNCHNTIMPAAIKGMERLDGGIYAFKSRAYLESKCMNSNSQLWFYIGRYISSHRPEKDH